MHILLVEDHVEVSDIALEFLSELGHTAVAVENAERALETLRGGIEFDAVMTDVSLPGISGIELAKELRTHYPTLPVIISSGYALDMDFLLGALSRGIFLLPKPYELSGLSDILQRAASFREP